MVIAIFGESCTGKSTLAENLKGRLEAQVYTGKDFLRLAKSEAQARSAFQALLARAAEGSETVVYVISEPEHLDLLPPNCIRVLVTAPLEEICRRFALRTGGRLPDPVRAMLERCHGCFDGQSCDIHIVSGQASPEENSEAVLALCNC